MKKIMLLLAIAAVPAFAHVSLEQTSGAAGAYQKLTFRVGHGCKGSPTQTLSVALPEGVTGAKPMPKTGWLLDATSAQSISWSGGSLPDAYYDEFSMQVKLPTAPGRYYFKVTQLCAQGRADWNETTPGASGKMESPAPFIEVAPAAGAGHVH